MSNPIPNTQSINTPNSDPTLGPGGLIKLDHANPSNMTQQLMDLLRPKDVNPADHSGEQNSPTKDKPPQA